MGRGRSQVPGEAWPIEKIYQHTDLEEHERAHWFSRATGRPSTTVTHVCMI